MAKPLLVTTTGTTRLDNLVRSIYPDYAIEFLNKTLLKIRPFEINNWSWFHLAFGALFYKQTYTLQFVAHTIFEFWEIWMADTPLADVSTEEWIDTILDTLIALFGQWFSRNIFIQ